MNKSIVLFFLFIILTAFAGDKKTYQLYSKEGKKVKYDKMMKALEEADVIFFGEQHNNPICHWLQLQVTKDIFEIHKENVVLGAEMFERDNQLLIDEYLNGLITKKNFEKEVRLWPNYKTDYAPLLELAKENNLDFIATNIPRRYASVVYSKGFEALEELNELALGFVAPVPIAYDPELKGYKDMLEMGGGHGGANLPKAQAIKDATMAWSIAEHAGPGKVFIHYNGTYHSNNFEGILWYLNQYKPGLKIVTIASEEQDNIDKLEEDKEGLADFILITPTDMTRTY
jgi:uncharacterized iron-regulated protein